MESFFSIARPRSDDKHILHKFPLHPSLSSTPGDERKGKLLGWLDERLLPSSTDAALIDRYRAHAASLLYNEHR
jgi:hypothetical protein